MDWVQNETTHILPEPTTFSISIELPETHNRGWKNCGENAHAKSGKIEKVYGQFVSLGFIF